MKSQGPSAYHRRQSIFNSRGSFLRSRSEILKQRRAARNEFYRNVCDDALGVFQFERLVNPESSRLIHAAIDRNIVGVQISSIACVQYWVQPSRKARYMAGRVNNERPDVLSPRQHHVDCIGWIDPFDNSGWELTMCDKQTVIAPFPSGEGRLAGRSGYSSC